MSKKMKKIGILGGMGPESTLLFYHYIIKVCQNKHGGQYGEDYPEIFILNLPIPDVVKTTKNLDSIFPLLLERIKKLEVAGSDFIVIPCNTAHIFFDKLKNKSPIPILNMIQETAEQVRKKKHKKVGLLATKTAVEKKFTIRFLIIWELK